MNIIDRYVGNSNAPASTGARALFCTSLISRGHVVKNATYQKCATCGDICRKSVQEQCIFTLYPFVLLHGLVNEAVDPHGREGRRLAKNNIHPLVKPTKDSQYQSNSIMVRWFQDRLLHNCMCWVQERARSIVNER